MIGTKARTAAGTPSGILTAQVAGRPWEAVRALREGIRDLRQDGSSPRLAFLYGIGQDGRIANLGGAAMIVLGYED